MLKDAPVSRIKIFLWGMFVVACLSGLIVLYAPPAPKDVANTAPLNQAAEEIASMAEKKRIVPKSPAQNFETFCAQCHGAEGKGDGTMARMMAKKPPSINPLSPAYKNDLTLLAQVIRNGKGIMPGFLNEIDEKSAQDLAQYVLNLEKP